jgi:hypothetical protein
MGRFKCRKVEENPENRCNPILGRIRSPVEKDYSDSAGKLDGFAALLADLQIVGVIPLPAAADGPSGHTVAFSVLSIVRDSLEGATR